MSDKHKQAPKPPLDDVDRLFARLGSKGADQYRDFSPGKLPVVEAVAPAVTPPAAPVAAPPATAAPAPAAIKAAPDPLPPPSPPILAAIRPLRSEPAPCQPVPAAAATATPLTELFKRLLQAEAAPTPAGPLRRMFNR